MTTRPPVARTEMLIRRRVSDVFEAFVEPGITARFWFTRGNDRLAPGQTVRWFWDMYGFSVPATVLAYEPNRRVRYEWGEGDDVSIVEYTFAARADDTTFVTIESSGFRGDADAVVAAALNATEGFTFVLAGAKAWLEHGIELGLVPDRHPDGLPEQPR
jgi:uncharacterized protein YndB with AHSA1/START domain